jgi:predicted lipoprotein with Yx(FWY)xxD motif
MEIVMTTLFRRFGRLGVGSATAAAFALGLAAVILVLSAPASARPQNGVSCNTAVTSAPTSPATVSAASTSYGRVLVVGGTGAKAGCSLYLLTSDPRYAQSGANFACPGTPIAALGGATCANDLWPALLTEGAPIAGPGVNQALLGTVSRADVVSGRSVNQVTYAGQPLYMFFQDESPGETDGANLFDNVVSPTGTWYLVEPGKGRVAPGRAQLELETFAGGTSKQTTWLAAAMNNHFRVFPDQPFPVYTFSKDRGDTSACTGECALDWPPVLTSEQPEAIGYAVDQNTLGTIARPDGTRQVTYNGKPLYLYKGDAYIGPLPSPFNGPGGINGDGASAFGGTFNGIPLN